MCLQFQDTHISAQVRCLVTRSVVYHLPGAPSVCSCRLRLCRLCRPLLAEPGWAGMLYRLLTTERIVELLQTLPFPSAVQINVFSFPNTKSECSSLVKEELLTQQPSPLSDAASLDSAGMIHSSPACFQQCAPQLLVVGESILHIIYRKCPATIVCSDFS